MIIPMGLRRAVLAVALVMAPVAAAVFAA
ncbi:MAG: hypothetical protein RJB26_1009, partial [Pseudomonadota bacterium]